MKSMTAALTFVFAAAPALLGQTPVNTSLGNVQGPHPFNVRDLVMMDRVSDPQLSPDGRYAAFTVRRTDYAANRGITAIYVLDLSGTGAPVQVVDKAAQPRLHRSALPQWIGHIRRSLRPRAPGRTRSLPVGMVRRRRPA